MTLPIPMRVTRRIRRGCRRVTALPEAVAAEAADHHASYACRN